MQKIGTKIILAIVVVIFCIDASCILFNYQNFISVNKRYTSSLAETMANTCNLVINGDFAEEYRNTGRRNTEYYETWNKLIDYRNTNDDIIDLCVVWFEEDGAHYIFDTELKKEGAFLGDVREFDEKQLAIKRKLINCEDSVSLDYGTHNDIYLPIKTSYNIPTAYVIVGISSVDNRKEQISYLVQLTVIITSIAFVFGIVLIGFMNICIISRINLLAQAAAAYDDVEAIDLDNSPLQHVQIESGDEIQRLHESMRKMERDIVHSTSSLAVAIWNSEHDSMTQLYNKGFYKETVTSWATKTSMGAIYFDIDNLKKMNDTYGHEKGDDAIIGTANFAKKYEEDRGYACRIGGDEFVLLVEDITEDEMVELINHMRQDPDTFLAPWCQDFICRIAVGGAAQKPGESVLEVIKRAEIEMYGNKHAIR